MWCLLLITLQVNSELNHRIDWVGEPNHRQPQDPSPTHADARIRSLTDARQAKNSVDDDNDDLQQRQEPIFGKGTYLEFVNHGI